MTIPKPPFKPKSKITKSLYHIRNPIHKLSKTKTNKQPNQNRKKKKNRIEKEDRDRRPPIVALPMVVAEFVDLCQMFPWRLTHKPKHKQRPKPRNRDPNPETKTQTRLAPNQSCWHGTIAVVEMWSSKIPSQMSPRHWFEKRVEDGSVKNGFWPWKRESSAAVGMGERERELEVWERERGEGFGSEMRRVWAS